MNFKYLHDFFGQRYSYAGASCEQKCDCNQHLFYHMPGDNCKSKISSTVRYDYHCSELNNSLEQLQMGVICPKVLCEMPKFYDEIEAINS